MLVDFESAQYKETFAFVEVSREFVEAALKQGQRKVGPIGLVSVQFKTLGTFLSSQVFED